MEVLTGITVASMTITQYLGTGSKSRGRMTITRQLNTLVSTPPYLRDEYDREAVIKGIANLRESLKGVANLTWITPPLNVTVEDFVDSVRELVTVDMIKPKQSLYLQRKLGVDSGYSGAPLLQPLDR